MNFFISGELDAEIAEVFRPIRQDVEKLLNENLGSHVYGSALEKISLIPIIVGPMFMPRPERRLIKHKSKVADYRIVVEYELFLKGSAETRKELLIENLLSAVADISKKLGNNFEGQRLYQDIINLFKLKN